MRQMYYVCIVLIMLAFATSGQIRPDPEYQEPITRQFDTSQCHELMVKELYAATDVADPQQQGHLWAAEAYKLLDLEGQTCE